MIGTVRKLLNSLDDRSIDYCHWKSNETLNAAVHGETDLDILCSAKDGQSFREALNTEGFIRLNDVAFTGYPGIENYVGYDSETGRCIHVHLHFELTLGTPFLKEYVTSWAPYVLDRHITDSEHGIPITDPAIELFLLIVRYSLKIRRTNPIARRSYFEGFMDEYDWLAARADESEIGEIAHELLNPTAAKRISALIENKPTIHGLVQIGSPVRSELDAYSTYSPWSTTPIALGRKGFRGIGKLNREVLNRPYPSRRKLPSSGIEVAIVGIDGSGKSTHLSALQDWLSWKIDIHSVYFGSGDGPSSLLRYPLKKLNELRGSSRASGSTHSQNSSNNREGFQEHSDRENDSSDRKKVGVLKAIWAVLLAREKQKKRRRATRARNRGMVVFMDRYPQNQFENINDGPLLASWIDANSKLLSRIAEWERKIYANLHDHSPDLVIKLKTDPEVAKERKPETSMSNLKRKAEIIDSLEYEDSRVVIVDTHRDIDTVLNTIKTEVWEEI